MAQTNHPSLERAVLLAHDLVDALTDLADVSHRCRRGRWCPCTEAEQLAYLAGTVRDTLESGTVPFDALIDRWDLPAKLRAQLPPCPACTNGRKQPVAV